jgi:hypothetical protein
VDAYDLVVSSGSVAAASEGSVTVSGGFQPNDCGSGKGYGNFVDLDGVRYAHLNSFGPSVVNGAHLLQGDQIGTQGGTGHVEPCCDLILGPDNPDPDYDPNCHPSDIGIHLHWEFLGSSSTPPIGGGLASSSNSIIGEFSTAGATLRNYYINHGSWNSIGWTYAHCNPGPCMLSMFPNLAWGRMQDFQHDPDVFGAQFATIHVANWDTSHAYRVDSLFWAPWAAGGWDANVGVYRPISMARQESGACPSGSVASCLVYQRFHLGYVWANTGLQAAAVFCPDVYPLPEGDGLVLGPDAQWVFSLVKNHTYEVRADIDGNGLVTSTEAQLVFAHAGQWCHP